MPIRVYSILVCDPTMLVIAPHRGRETNGCGYFARTSNLTSARHTKVQAGKGTNPSTNETTSNNKTNTIRDIRDTGFDVICHPGTQHFSEASEGA